MRILAKKKKRKRILKFEQSNLVLMRAWLEEWPEYCNIYQIIYIYGCT